MLQLQVTYTESGKKYTFPFELLKKFVDDDTLAKIQAEVLKEIRKL